MEVEENRHAALYRCLYGLLGGACRLVSLRALIAGLLLLRLNSRRRVLHRHGTLIAPAVRQEQEG